MNDVTGIREGDAGMFREVYHQFHLKVFRYFLKRTAVRETALELTQLLFIKLWQSRHTLSGEYSLEVQLFTMANSVFIDHLRREANNRKYYTTTDDLTPVTTSRHDQSAHHAWEVSDHFQLAIRELPPVRRKVFILKILHGFTNQEIAGQLSVSVKTVEDHLYKAVRYIRSVLTVGWFLLLMLS